MRRTVLPAVVTASAVLALTGCANDTTVASNVALQFPPDGLWWARVDGPLLLAALAIVVGVLDAIVLVSTLRALRAQRPVRRRPILVALLGTLVLTAAAVGFAVFLLVSSPFAALTVFG